MEGNEAWWLVLVLLLMKVLATGLTLGSGNPGGSFAPAVFIGVMGGAAFGSLMTMAGLTNGAMPYAVMGMAGLIAGALGAPVTAIMITLRHGNNASDMILPVMTTVALCVFVMQFGRGVSVYTLGFLRSGIDLDRARTSDPLSLLNVKAVTHTTDYEFLPASMPVFEALERIKDSTMRWFIVQGEDEKFMGIISLHEMRMAIAEDELAQLLVLADITDPFLPRLSYSMNLKQALSSFSATESELLPVFADDSPDASLMGVISRQDALDAYAQATTDAD
jgi:CIC family chloride channel protein